jgi:hypothetical protein
VRPLALVVLAGACSSADRDDRAAPPATSVPSAPRTSIDITVTGVPVSIRGVEAHARPDGDVEITYRVEAKDAGLVPTLTMCRVAGRNVVYPMAPAGKVAGPRLSSLFRADPFNEPVSVCLITFVYMASEVALSQVAGSACFEAGTLRDGPCPPSSFPPPELPAAGAIVLEQSLLELRDNSAVVTALFSLTQPVERDRRLLATLRCEDPRGATTAEAGLPFVPLQEIPVGGSVYGPVTFALERTPAPEARCALQIVSRPVGDNPGGERVHAHYCLTKTTVRTGRC